MEKAAVGRGEPVSAAVIAPENLEATEAWNGPLFDFILAGPVVVSNAPGRMGTQRSWRATVPEPGEPRA